MVDFLLLGNVVAAHYDEVFSLMMDERVFFGYSISSGGRYFRVPDDYEFSGQRPVVTDGKRFIRVKGVRWFSSFEVEDRCPLLLKKYKEGDYRRFDDTNIINIDSREDICDYDGVIGVPITFLDKWCRRQFKIVGIADRGSGGVDMFCPRVDGESKFTRILIKRK